MRRLLLVATAAAALALPAAASATINTYYGYNYLTSTSPTNACLSVFPSGSTGLACDGYNNWDRSRVYKNSGGWIKVGFWSSSGPTDYYFEFTGTINNPPIVVLRTDVGAPSYNATFCGYDYGMAPTASSYVQCQSIIF